MKKFKMKKKAYSKNGLTSGQKLDPADLERVEISMWLNQCLENLNIQIDQFEAEIETLNRTQNAEQLEELNGHIEKHRDHVQKLKTLLRVLDNDTVNINQIKDIKEDVEYYIDHCQDPEFMENDMIYEHIDGLEEMLLDVSHLSFMITATLK
jgi:CCR4-NOT transcription complex subunit 3